MIPTGRKSQRKGADGERELAALLREYGYPVERGGSLSFGEVPDLVGLPSIHVECKRAEQLRPYDWIDQAEREILRHYLDSAQCSMTQLAKQLNMSRTTLYNKLRDQLQVSKDE